MPARQAYHHDLDGRPVSAQVGDMWLKKSGLKKLVFERKDGRDF